MAELTDAQIEKLISWINAAEQGNYRDPEPLDPNKKYTIEELAKFVREKLFGRDVREAFARSMEATNEVAEWSREVAQQIVDGDFDEGALKTEIERKLNELEQNYAPQLSELKTEIENANGGYDSLAARLLDFDSQFTQKQKEIEIEADKNFYNSVTPNRIRRPVLTLIDDDGRSEVWTILKPLAEKLNIPIACAIISSVIDNNPAYLTSTQMEELSKIGFEFVGHTDGHINLTDSSTDEIYEDLRKNRQWLLERGYNADVLVYPYGTADFNARSIIARFFRLGMLSDRGEGLVNKIPINSYGLQRVYIDYGVDYCKTRIDDIVANGGWMILGMHCHYDDFDPLEVEEIVNYARSKGVAIENTRNAIKYYGNYMEVGQAHDPASTGFLIDANGKVHGRTVGRYIRGSFTSADAYKPVTDYAEDAVTTGYSTTNDGGFPENGGGVFEVHRFRNDAYSYRRWKAILTSNWYESDWDNDNKQWRSWRLISSKVSPRIERSVSIGVIGGKETRATTVSAPGSWANKFIVATPDQPLPANIILGGVWMEGSDIRMRFYNNSQGSVDLASQRWYFTYLDA